MSLFVSGKSDFTPAPEGMHPAVCVDVVDLGLKDTPFGKKAKIRIVWELACKMDDGKPFLAQKQYTASLHEKANLHQDLKGWRGRPFTAEEIMKFDVEAVLLAPCQVVIQHQERDGTVYGNVIAILRAEAGKQLKASGNYQRMKDRAPDNQGGHSDSNEPGPPPDDDDIPF